MYIAICTGKIDYTKPVYITSTIVYTYRESIHIILLVNVSLCPKSGFLDVPGSTWQFLEVLQPYL